MGEEDEHNEEDDSDEDLEENNDAEHRGMDVHDAPMDSEEEDVDDMLVVKRTIENEPEEGNDIYEIGLKRKKGTRTVFYDEGSGTETEEEEDMDMDQRVRARMDAVRQAVREGDVEDKRRVKERQREIKLLKKRKRNMEQGNQEAEAAVTLGHRSLQPVGSSESEQDDVEEDLSEEDIEVNDAPSTHQMPTNLEEQEALALKLLS